MLLTPLNYGQRHTGENQTREGGLTPASSEIREIARDLGDIK